MDIRIETLGGLNVRVEGGILNHLREQPVRAALLVFLAVEREATRDRVTGILWPDQPPDRARHTLSQTLYRLRQDLGDTWVRSAGEHLRVADYVHTDVEEFSEVAGGPGTSGPPGEAKAPPAPPRDQAALALYKGPFLQGWGLSVTSEFEQWCDRQRLKLSRLHREVCRRHIVELRSGGATASALETAQHWVEVDPLEDEAQHLLVELLAESGRRAEALEHFESYRTLLAADDLQPLDETIELVEEIRGKPGTPASRGAAPPLEGPVSGSPTPGPADSRSPPPDEADSAAPRPGPADSPPPTPGAGASTPKSHARPRGLVLLALVFATAIGGWGIYQLWAPGQTTSPSPVANRVLVVPLEDRTERPDLTYVGGLAADWITRGLSDLDFLEVRPAAEFMAVDASEETQRGSSGREAESLASRVGAGILVSGTYYTWGPGLEFHVQILDLPGGHVLEAIGPVRSETMDPMETVDLIRQRVAVAVAIHLDENLTPLSASALPPTLEAYQAYSSGARKFVVGNRAEAVADLEEAYHRSPDFTAPLIYAAFGRLGIGDPQGADSLARILEADRDRLPPYDEYRLELLQARLRGDNAGAYRAARLAAELLDGGSAHYMSGQMALELNRPQEALENLSTFDITREWAQAWAPYWNVVTSAHHLLGNHQRELELAREGYRLNPDRMLMLAWNVRALAALGRWNEIQPLLARARGIRGPDQMTAGPVMLMAAHELRRHEYDNEAASCLNEALEWVSEQASGTPGSESLRAFRAQTLYHKGALQQRRNQEGAAATLRQAQLEFRALATESPAEPSYLGYLGAIQARLGDIPSAREISDSLQTLDRPYLRGQNTYWRARIAAVMGDPEEAVRLLWVSAGEGVPFGVSMHADPDLESLRGFPGFEELMRPKG